MSRVLSRRSMLRAAGATGAAAAGSTIIGGPPTSAVARAVIASEPSVENGIAWYDVSDWGVEGRGWPDTARYFDRFPARAEATVRAPVWDLSRQSAGMATRFETDATSIHTRYRLSLSRISMAHMPATGVSGVDLYARLDDGRDFWVGGTRPAAQSVQAQLVGGLDPGSRRYTAYLPLYNGVDSLEIGVPVDAAFHPVAPRTEKPAVFYGTSIMQGGVASRPGMSITAILGRWFDMPTINLGFSGNGTMDLPVGELLAELDASVYVLDCCPNMTPQQVADRTEPLVHLLREARPDVPILLVEDRVYTHGVLVATARDRNAGNQDALRAAYQRMRTSGVQHLRYLRGDELMGTDGEGAVDGSHPSDLGGMRYAEAYRTALRPILHG
jgi:hypothetical protein